MVDDLLSSLWSRRDSNANVDVNSSATAMLKVVIVSSFTSTLDVVEMLANARGWSTLRLDGSVPTSRRQPLVDAFNRQSDTRRLFLLSAKAGGVGINL